MTVDRKRKASENESAVSKLRRARSETSRTPTREPSPVARPVNPSKVTSRREQSKKQTRNASKEPPRQYSEVPKVFESQTEDENQFAALGGSVVDQGNRIYERLDGSRVRVELSNGADCIIAGHYTLWVKHGTVTVMGAVLRASPELYTIFAPLLLSLPAIRATQGDAEFEIAEISNRHNTGSISTATQLNATECSYQILGLDFAMDTPNMRRPRLLDLDDNHFRDFSNSSFGRNQCMIFGGSRSSESTTMARCLLNRMLTAQDHQNGVVLLDFSSAIPILETPGMLSVVVVREPLLGPSFGRFSQQGVETIRKHFVGPPSVDLQPHWWFDACVRDLIDTASAYRQKNTSTPVLIHISNSTALSEALVHHLWNVLSPTSVSIADSPTLPLAITRVAAWAKTNEVPIRWIPSINENPHTARLHSKTLQSYFNTLQENTGNPHYQFAGEALELGDMSFRYSGPQTEVLAVSSVDTAIPAFQVHRAIVGMLAAVVLTRSSDMTTLKDGTFGRCSTSRLPVLEPLTMGKVPAHKIQYVGLCYVTTVDITEGKISVKSPIHPKILQDGLASGHGVILIMQPPTRENDFALLDT